jgi:sulfur carrier protein ThiS|tara:strand:+ start:1732 stop:1971 length:240 start_codon:yes stop_codon:yes gene_type:complete
MVRQSTSEAGDSIEITVARMGERVETFVLPKDSTVADALNSAGVSSETRVKVAGAEVSSDDLLDDGDRLVISSKVSGGC